MKITGIEPHRYRKGSYAVFIDGNYSFSISSRVLQDTGIDTGMEVSTKDIDDITGRNEFFDALDYAYLLLSYRKRSRSEVRMKLKRKNFSDMTVEKTIKTLEDTGYLDDLEFAVWWIRQRRKSRPKGNYGLISELRKKGVSPETAEKAMAAVEEESPSDEVALAWKACESILDNYRKLPRKTAYRRLANFLKRRGFSWDTVKIITEKFFT